MKIAIPILSLMMATTIFPISGYSTETNATPPPPPIDERVWTIDGRPIPSLHYVGIEEQDGTKYAFFTSKHGGGTRRFTLDMLSPEDIDAIKNINPTLEPENKMQLPNNRLQSTTHNLSLCNRFCSLQSYTVQPLVVPEP